MANTLKLYRAGAVGVIDCLNLTTASTAPNLIARIQIDESEHCERDTVDLDGSDQ